MALFQMFAKLIFIFFGFCDDSEDDDIDDRILNLYNGTRPQRQKRGEKSKIENYIKIIHRYSDVDFKSHFRLSRTSVEGVIKMLQPFRASATTKPKTCVEVNVLLSLWLMSNKESFRGVASRFGIAKGHCHREFTWFVKKMSAISHQIIVWPTDAAAKGVVSSFNQLRGFHSFPNVLGCIDGTHITISALKNDPADYYNRKCFTSILLQAVCDHHLKFIDVFTGWPGSSNDASVFRRNPLYRRLIEDESFMPPGTHLLGDSAYPLSDRLMTPFENIEQLSEQQKLFNETLSSTRVLIEQAFGQLFGRFRRLKHLHVLRSDRFKDIVMTGCMLHNICVAESESADIIEDFISIPVINNEGKREAIAQYIHQNY